MGSKKTVLILPILIVVLVLLNIPIAAGTAVTDTQEEVKRIQEEIASNRASLDKATLNCQQALSEIHTLDDKIQKNEAELSRTKTKIEGLKKNLDNRVINMYKAGPSSFLSVLVFSDDFTEFITRAKFVSYVIYSDYDLITKTKMLEASFDKQNKELAADRAERARQLALAESAWSTIYQQVTIQKARLAQIESETAPRRIGRLAMAHSASASQSYVSRGGGRSGSEQTGFVFPVNGANSYIDSWGAARSGGRRHKGTDIMASTGTPVVACVSGTINRTSPYDRGLGGITIYLDGDDGNTYYYAHLHSITTGISAGTRVEAGQLIGAVGSTGNASARAPHLHFEIHKGGGSAINPYSTLRSAE